MDGEAGFTFPRDAVSADVPARGRRSAVRPARAGRPRRALAALQALANQQAIVVDHRTRRRTLLLPRPRSCPSLSSPSWSASSSRGDRPSTATPPPNERVVFVVVVFRLLDRERDSVLKSLSQILGEVATQVRDTDSRVAALEAANRAERAEREAWKVRAERAEGRAGDLERKLDATREELLAMHDKTASKVAKIAKDSAKSPEADSPRVSAMRREVESLDRYARETRAIVERLEAGAES